MNVVERLVIDVAHLDGWQVLPRRDASWETLPTELPDDLATFARICGGVRTPEALVIGQRVRHAQRALLGAEYPEDRSSYWYVIAEDDIAGSAQRAVIDLHPARMGRCYEAFWDRFAVAGSATVVATSFTDLLARVIDARGAAYWSTHALGMGDAYD